jgi:hypothetical protein
VKGWRGERINGIGGSARQGEIIRYNARIYRVGVFMNHAIATCRHIAMCAWGGGRKGGIFPSGGKAIGVEHGGTRFRRCIGRGFVGMRACRSS